MGKISPRKGLGIAPDRGALFKYFFFAVFLLLLYQLFLLITPFLTALLGAATLALAFHPAHVQLSKRIKMEGNSAALASTLSVIAIVVLPVVLLGWLLVREAAQLAPAAQKILEGIQVAQLSSLPESLPGPLQEPARMVLQSVSQANLEDLIVRNVKQLGTRITTFGTAVAKNALFFLFNLAILGLALFYAFRDGAKLLRWTLLLIPMPPSHKQRILQRLYQTFQAIVVGALTTASIQGILATFGYWLAGFKLPFLLGVLTTLSALFPGSFLVTVPVALYVFTYDKIWGLFLLAWGLGVVGTVDNILKPILIGSRARLPILLLFFGIFGAVRVYGFFGLILGPLLITCVLAFVQIYREEFFQTSASASTE